MTDWEARRKALEELRLLVQGLQRNDGNLVMLSDYEVANLRALFQAMGYATDVIRNPLMAAHNGDWVGQIFQKLPDVDHEPNAQFDELAQRACAYEATTQAVPPPASHAPRSFRTLDGQPHDFDCPRLLPENRQGNTTICCKAEADRQKAAGV